MYKDRVLLRSSIVSFLMLIFESPISVFLFISRLTVISSLLTLDFVFPFAELSNVSFTGQYVSLFFDFFGKLFVKYVL